MAIIAAAAYDGLKLSRLQLRIIFVEILGYQAVPKDNALLAAGPALVLWTADLLERMEFLKPDQRALLIRRTAPMLLVAGEQLKDGPPARIYQLAFADGRYAVWTDATGALDLETGEVVDKTPVTPLEGISYNLTELFRRKTLRQPGRGM